ncbi:glycosyltransferase involved in cell wall biosynthesis [Desulfobaculum xiamenense]|uniref:Glycosyltransferase involved in cell wall biosynthesis n=1 Tax=Desulfobaculum xiamenense TaxID=995050 RepID=A0A846QHR2_9BACT|nr:glycosyltransferase family 2 protein [Desulfobaculum xiamenense]NJB67741.1 glycosyltransferase involved in cell wall biosynthesis [Desulfobaculum xiamenense]
MTRHPTVSVVLPAFDAAQSLPACLDSLLAQDMDDFEIIAVDDGSTDDTADILNRHARRDERLHVVNAPHAGVAHAFNTGIAQATGRYIARMDADDVCHPSRLRLQAAHLDANHDTGLVACRVAFGGCRETCAGYAHHVDWTNTLVSAEDIALNRFVDLPFANPAVMFRAELAERLGGARDGDFPEDYDMWLRWLDAGVRMEKLPQTLVTWNDPPTRLTRNDTRYDPEAFYRVKAHYLARWLAAHNPQHPEVYVLGAGRPTRRRADMLLAHGVAIAAYVDVDPKKIGMVIDGRPVIAHEDLPGPGHCFMLSYVANRGARERIARMLAAQGYAIGRDYLPAA